MIEEHIMNLTRHNDVVREIALNNLWWLDDYRNDCNYIGSHPDFHKALYVTQRAINAYQTDFKNTRHNNE